MDLRSRFAGKTAPGYGLKANRQAHSPSTADPLREFRLKKGSSAHSSKRSDKLSKLNFGGEHCFLDGSRVPPCVLQPRVAL